MTTTFLDVSKVGAHITSTTTSRRSSSSQSSLPPNYYDNTDIIELGAVTPSTTASTTSLPKYDSLHDNDANGASSQTAFHATRALQIEALGHCLVSLPVPPKPYPIGIFEVSPTGAVGPEVYKSYRATRSSGNSVLVRADDASETPLCSTTYRFGPGRPPRIRLHGAASASASASASAASSLTESITGHEEEFQVQSRGCTTRAQVIRTHLGTFLWRYADRKERRAEGADSLLVLEKITTVALEGGKQEERRQRVAQLVRNKEFRSKFTSRRTAGNGGRLLLDVREWAEEKGAVEQMEAITIASCLVMLKKEIDRRRAVQAMVIAGAASS